jgi:CheY-like chemotaxis protein
MYPDLVVLIVEDEPFLRYSMAYALRGDGWLILEASSGEKAVAYLTAGEKVDIVFTDITLGGLLSGWDVADAFRLARSEIPVIYTSGNADGRSRQVKDSQFFQKPYDTTAVVKACQQIGERHGRVPDDHLRGDA